MSDVFSNLFKTDETEKYQVMRTFFEEHGIEFKTDLTNSEIDLIVSAEFIDSFLIDEWKINIRLSRITDSKKRHKVSKGREGRKEAFRALSRDDDGENESKLKKMLGI